MKCAGRSIPGPVTAGGYTPPHKLSAPSIRTRASCVTTRYEEAKGSLSTTAVVLETAHEEENCVWHSKEHKDLRLVVPSIGHARGDHLRRHGGLDARAGASRQGGHLRAVLR